ncbi:MAG: tRNA (adenine-N1)-methyltransferase [Thaumarchaeota archaeon]|nr:tRNA (adenine-N1)-methyltransferase [Nitrososphaerota archaeon]
MSNNDRDIISIGDRVLLYLDSRRTWLVELREGMDSFHTHAGIVDLKKIPGLKFGDSISTTLNDTIRILKPTILDFIMKSERRTQIVYPKDFAYIATRSGLRSGSRVLECGTGSGALTTFFASIVAPGGLVHTFEEREDFYTISGKNIEKARMSSFVKRENANLREAALEEGSYDLVMLDTGDPWTLLETAHRSLKGSGFVFCICPTTNQLENVASTMEGKFVDVESVEILFRRMEARAGKTRPSTRMIGHTCYLASGRKVNPSVENVISARESGS